MALLKNEHIRLRALEPEDLEWLYEWENNADLWRVGHSLTPYSRYILKEYIAESHRDIFDLKQLRLIIEICDTHEAVGMIDLFDFDPHHRRAGVGILVDEAYQGKGIGAEALLLLIDYSFSFLKLHQLYAHMAVNNVSSKNLFSRCGFTVSGTINDWLIDENGYQDVYLMQRINTEE